MEDKSGGWKTFIIPAPQQSFAREPISAWFYHLNLTVCSMFRGPNPFCLIQLLANTHEGFQSKLPEFDFSAQNISAYRGVEGNRASANHFLLTWKIVITYLINIVVVFNTVTLYYKEMCRMRVNECVFELHISLGRKYQEIVIQKKMSCVLWCGQAICSITSDARPFRLFDMSR